MTGSTPITAEPIDAPCLGGREGAHSHRYEDEVVIGLVGDLREERGRAVDHPLRRRAIADVGNQRDAIADRGTLGGCDSVLIGAVDHDHLGTLGRDGRAATRVTGWAGIPGR